MLPVVLLIIVVIWFSTGIGAVNYWLKHDQFVGDRTFSEVGVMTLLGPLSLAACIPTYLQVRADRRNPLNSEIVEAFRQLNSLRGLPKNEVGKRQSELISVISDLRKIPAKMEARIFLEVTEEDNIALREASARSQDILNDL